MRRISWGAAILAIAAVLPTLALAGDQRDEAMAENIATVLRDSGRMKNYSVGVKYKGGRVWLSGRVSNNQQMQTALEVISDMDGVDEIVNNMTISPGSKSLQQPAGRQTSASMPFSRIALRSRSVRCVPSVVTCDFPSQCVDTEHLLRRNSYTPPPWIELVAQQPED